MNAFYPLFIVLAIFLVPACGPNHTGGTGGGDTAPCGGCLNSSLGCEAGTDVLVCGKDGNSCQECVFPNGTGACVDGACVLAACDSYWMNCDGAAGNGCEIEKTDRSNCGACSWACGPEQKCADSFVQGELVFECK